MELNTPPPSTKSPPSITRYWLEFWASIHFYMWTEKFFFSGPCLLLLNLYQMKYLYFYVHKHQAENSARTRFILWSFLHDYEWNLRVNRELFSGADFDFRKENGEIFIKSECRPVGNLTGKVSWKMRENSIFTFFLWENFLLVESEAINSVFHYRKSVYEHELQGKKEQSKERKEFWSCLWNFI